MGTTPFGPIDQPRQVVDNVPTAIPTKRYPTENPQLAHLNAATNDIDMLEYMRVRRMSCHYDKITLCHSEWRTMNRLNSSQQQMLAHDFYRMVALPLPWFSGEFRSDHARILAAVFDDREIWYEDQLVMF